MWSCERREESKHQIHHQNKKRKARGKEGTSLMTFHLDTYLVQFILAEPNLILHLFHGWKVQVTLRPGNYFLPAQHGHIEDGSGRSG